MSSGFILAENAFGYIRPVRRGDLDPECLPGVTLLFNLTGHVVGRGHPDADVRVRVDSRKVFVGNNHAVISWDSNSNTATIMDQSQNGTWVNGLKLTRRVVCELRNNSMIWLGPPYHELSCGELSLLHRIDWERLLICIDKDCCLRIRAEFLHNWRPQCPKSVLMEDRDIATFNPWYVLSILSLSSH
ncbi:unnamed protein product [Peniophora sp. CBMAI 1063]|nr:unnamed protein product [Peniophora sp. CBMAI 1063]